MAVDTQYGERRWPPLAVSVAIHGVAFIALVDAPAIELPRAAESEYKQVIAGKEEKLVWYKFRKELPAVAPSKPITDPRPLRAAVEAKQSVVSAPKSAPKRDQMVWTPAPQIAPAPLLESPNILAVRLPDRRFINPPSTPPPAPVQPRLAGEAPELAAQSIHGAELPSMRLPPKPFVAPPSQVRPPATRVATLGEAPVLAAGISAGASASVASPMKLPARPFTAPPAGTASTVSRIISVEAPPALNLPDSSKDLNVAIVGLKPIDTRAPLPSASSPADFSAGPKVRPDGAASEAGAKGVSVPDLFVRGPREAKPDLLAQAYASPTSRETIRAAMNRGDRAAPPLPQPAPARNDGSAKVTSAPDPRFNGRDVYMMAIQMPNLTSYSGSWLMWYAGRTEREAGLNPVSAPVAHRKVDPKYIATAVEERIEGRVQLACVIDEEGKVSQVELIRGADPRLNQSAEEALAKWEFYPAVRNGEPVAVDVLVEIPFRLAPRPPQPR